MYCIGPSSQTALLTTSELSLPQLLTTGWQVLTAQEQNHMFQPCAARFAVVIPSGNVLQVVTMLCLSELVEMDACLLNPNGAARQDQLNRWAFGTGKVSIFAEDQQEPVSVDCTATIVSSTFEVMDEQGAAMSQLDFGALHYGDDKQVTFSVLNNGPKPARFFAACGTPQQLAEDTDAAAPRDDPMTAFIQVMLAPLDTLPRECPHPHEACFWGGGLSMLLSRPCGCSNLGNACSCPDFCVCVYMVFQGSCRCDTRSTFCGAEIAQQDWSQHHLQFVKRGCCGDCLCLYHLTGLHCGLYVCMNAGENSRGILHSKRWHTGVHVHVQGHSNEYRALANNKL